MADSSTDDELLLAINASVVAVIALQEIQENSCALLGGFAVGARVALLWQHNANPSYKCEREMLASAMYSLYA